MPQTPPRDQQNPNLEAQSFQRVLEERDQLFRLQEALGEVERARTLEERLRVFVEAIQRLGFGRVTITLRDERLEPTMTVSAGLTPEQERDIVERGASGETWRRRLAGLERFRTSQSYYLDSRDPWIAAEFGSGAIASALPPCDDHEWSPRDAILVPLRGGSGQIIATLIMDDPTDRARPTLERVRIVELFGQQAASIIERVRLVGIAQRRAERLQLLQESGVALARSLDEQEIVAELARHAQRAVRGDGALAIPVDAALGWPRSGLRRSGSEEAIWSASPKALVRLLQLIRPGGPVQITAGKDGELAELLQEITGHDSPSAAVLLAPVTTTDGVAAIAAVWCDDGSFSWEDEELLITMGSQAGFAIVNARLYSTSQRERRIGEALTEIARAVNAAVRRGDLMLFILRHAAALLRVEGANLSLLRDDELEVVAGIGSGEVLIGSRLPVDGSLSGRVLREGEYRISNDAQRHPEIFEPTRRTGGITKLLIVPLFGAEGPIGTLSVHNRENDFSTDEAVILQRFADQVGVALVNARLFEEERRARREMEKSETRYARVVESASDAIITIDPEGRLTSLNPSLERSVGRRRDELLGKRFHELLDGRDASQFERVLFEVLVGRKKRASVRYLAADGEIRYASVILTPMYDGERVASVLCILRDVTDERRLTEQLLQQEKLAAVGQLVSGVAHELNNPLAGVVAFSQILLASPDIPDEQRRAVETIHAEARRAARIVQNLLTFARQRSPERSTTDLNKVVADALELRRYSLTSSRVEIQTELDPQIPLTWADPFQLQQVLLNLLTNAEHAMADWPGERRIHIRTWADSELLHVSVADTGPGVSEVHIGNVFDPFFTTKGVGEGTGLGLSISDGIVREHGGRIRVESRPGSGATFTVELPYAPPPAQGEQDQSPGPAAAPSRYTVLVVDDEPAIRTALTTFFKSLGHSVDAVGSGREALSLTHGRSYDAILLDLRMPDVSGDMVFEELRTRSPELADRVIFLTGDTQSESARHFFMRTGRPVLSKPFALDDIAAVLVEVAEG
jgi:two-component system, NtrC family, sensor kinase